MYVPNFSSLTRRKSCLIPVNPVNWKQDHDSLHCEIEQRQDFVHHVLKATKAIISAYVKVYVKVYLVSLHQELHGNSGYTTSIEEEQHIFTFFHSTMR